MLMIAAFPFILPVSYADNTTLKVGYSDSDGITMDEQGNYTGYAVAYLEAIAEYTGWEYEYIFDSWDNCMSALEDGSIDMLLMMLYTPERAERFLFSEMDMGPNYTVLYTTPGRDIYYQDYSTLDGCRIGVAAETFFERSLTAYIEELGLNCQVIPYPTENEAKEAMSCGEIELMAASIFASYPDLKPVDHFGAAPSYIATGKQKQELMKQINAAMQRITIEQPELEDQLTAAYHDTPTSGLHLTREEQEYINSADTINVRMFANRHPVMYRDGNEIKGILPDYLDMLGELTGLRFNYIQAETDSALAEADLLEEDGSILLSSTESLLKTDLHHSRSIMPLELSYIKRIRDESSFEPTTLAVLHNMNVARELFAEDYTLLFYDTVEECMEAVINGEADMTVQYELMVSYQMPKPEYADKLVGWIGPDYNLGVYLYGTEEHTLLFRILDKTQKHLSDGQRTVLISTSLMRHTYTTQLSDLLYQHKGTILLSIMALVVLILTFLLHRRIRHTKQQAMENKELQRRLWTDELTGLYNREGFFANAREMISRLGGDAVIMRVNLCQFKQINELYGLENGDMILQDVGSHLKQMKTQTPMMTGRFSADHFYLCAASADVDKLSLIRQISLPSLDLNINLTYGIYPVWQEPDIPINVMCDRADIANAAAQPMTNQYVYYYSDEEHQRLRYEQMMEREMETALRDNQFLIYIQPKYDLDTESIVGGEVLVRWLHPEHGLIPPYKFIGLFERNGFIRQLDYYVWEKCCQYISEIKKAGISPVPLSVNMSRIHFYGFESILKLTELLEQYGLNHRDVELEITESLCAENPDILCDKCRQLRDLGFRVAMDDFGSGYSSLSTLKEIPLDILKMDLRFLSRDNDTDQYDRGHNIVRSVIELAHTIGLDVVVEGLETREQRDFIREIGGCSAQGYYYARPMPTSDFTQLLQSGHTETSGHPSSGMAADLRRERLRREQLQPLLEVISVSDNLIGLLLPEKEGILSSHLAQVMECPQRIPDLADYVAASGIITPESMTQWEKLIHEIDQGKRSGSAIVEYLTPLGNREPHWIQYDVVLDYEGNPLITIFTISEFEYISEQVESLIADMQSRAEVESRQRKETEKLLSIITQHSDRIVCLYDVNKRSSRIWNSDACRHCQLPRLCETTSDGILEDDTFTPESKDALRKMFRDIEHGVSSGNTKVQIYSEDGSLRWMDLLFSTIYGDNGKPESALISSKDVTQQYEHEMAYLRQFQSLSETEFSLGMMEVDLTLDRIELQDSLFAPMEKSMVGSSMSDFTGQMITLKMKEEDWDEARIFFSPEFLIHQHNSGNRLISRTWPIKFLSGKQGWVRFDVELIADIYSGHIRAYFRLWDISSIREKQLELQHRAERDGMTGLYNRSTTEDLIYKALADDSTRGIFVILDLDRLKQINDGFGHAAGDNALIRIAQILTAHFRSSDIIGRIGGDEFVVYLPGAAKNRDVISATLTQLLRKLSALSVGEHGEMGVTCSMGCAVEQEDSTYEALYRQADKALYHVKKSGKNNFAFYSPEMENDSFICEMDKLFSLDHAKRSESSDVQHLLSALSSYYHLVLACNITENSYHVMQEVEGGIFAKFPTFGKMDNMVTMSEMRMTPEDAQRFDNAVSRHALIQADARGDKYVTICFDFQDFDGQYYPAECTSILYRSEDGDLCEFALIRWRYKH